MVIETAEPDRTAALVPPPADTCVTLAPASPPPAGTGEFPLGVGPVAQFAVLIQPEAEHARPWRCGRGGYHHRRGAGLILAGFRR